MTFDDIIEKYATAAQAIYDGRLAGTGTWSGLLASFAFEMAAASAPPKAESELEVDVITPLLAANARRVQ